MNPQNDTPPPNGNGKPKRFKVNITSAAEHRTAMARLAAVSTAFGMINDRFSRRLAAQEAAQSVTAKSKVQIINK